MLPAAGFPGNSGGTVRGFSINAASSSATAPMIRAACVRTFAVMTAPIDLAPSRAATKRRLLAQVRRGAGWLHLALALTIVVAVFVQVYLIGSYIFGAGQGALDAHRDVGFTAHGLEVLILIVAVVAWLPRRDLVLSVLLAVIGTGQVMLASGHRWVGGLHPLLALVVLGLAGVLARRGVRARHWPTGSRRNATAAGR